MTAADLQEHIGVIDKMKSLLNSADFDQVFRLLTSDLPKSKQFLLKMELKRLAQPCNYYIDLRGHVDAEVKSYVYQGKTHYMDDNAIKVFETGLQQYGSYTLGLYEEVMNTDNNFRVMHRRDTEKRVRKALKQTPQQIQQETTAESDHYARLVQFGNYATRQDERMNFSVEVVVQLDNKHFDAVTSDLSVSGCKLKVSGKQQIEVGHQLQLHFTGLEQEFTLDLPDGVPYEVVDVDKQGQQSYWRLKRLGETEQQFVQFLQNFINGNKRRYKVNLDSAIDSLVTKGYEQFYIPRISSLPVFIAVREGKAVPVCTLTTDYNKAVWQYFLDEQHLSIFYSVCSGRRLKQLMQQPGSEKSGILYSFTHAVKGKLFFYTATADELAQSAELRNAFLGFGASKASWRVFHFNLLRTAAEHAEVPQTVPEAQGGTKTEVLSALVKSHIKDLRYIINVTDITNTANTFWYQSRKYDQQHLKLLAPFGHKKLADFPICEAVPVQYVNLRSESRYLYKTAVTIGMGEEQPALRGFSRDFSSKGLQVECTLPVRFNKGDIIKLNLPDMQKISSKFILTDLPYEIMAISKSRTIMNLRIAETDTPHTGRLFFQQLIQSNRAKLTLAEESPKYPGLSSALRNMYLTAQNNFAFYLHRKGIRYELNVIAQGSSLNLLHRLLALHSSEPDQLNLALLIQNNGARLHFAQQLKQMKRFDMPKSYELFIRCPRVSDVTLDNMICRYDYEFDSEQAKQAFVTEALQQDMLFCFRLYLSRTGRPDTDYIAKELSYISTYAIHKAKVLEEELWSVAGIGDAIDISHEVPLRYGVNIEPQQLQKWQQLLLG